MLRLEAPGRPVTRSEARPRPAARLARAGRPIARLERAMEPLGRPLLVPCHCRNARVLWLRRSRAVSVLQLLEGLVVGGKTCVKALLRACLSLDSRFALSPKCSSLRWRRMVKMELITE